MVAASAMTAMAATNYFYVYENGTFGPARMGQDCVESVEVDGDEVTMYLQEGSYGTFTGSITDAWIDSNGNGKKDAGEESLYYKDEKAIIYDQEALKTTINGNDYAEFNIEVSISGSMTMTKTQHTYVPIQ